MDAFSMKSSFVARFPGNSAAMCCSTSVANKQGTDWMIRIEFLHHSLP
jgi:hypothetical protein